MEMNRMQLEDFAKYAIEFGLKYGMHGVTPKQLVKYYIKDTDSE